MTYILLDMANLYHRSFHVVRGDIETKIGMALHIIFASMNKMWRDLDGTHVVAAFEGRSWRKDFYVPYKANRSEKRAAQTPTQAAESQMGFDAFDKFQEFLNEKTNVSVLQAPGCEADDFIARWIQTHPDDNHVIVSSDSDFYQLICENVSQYNGVSRQLMTHDSILDEKGKQVVDKKTGEPKLIGDPEWVLFEKCIRGDTSDNIFSAYPGARTKGTKNKIGIEDAFADRHGKGFNYNNFMLQTWTDHNDVEHRVRDDYHRNVTLVDLTQQPDHIKTVLDEAIVTAVQAEHKSQVGLRLMQFCGTNDLPRVGESATDHAKYLGASYANQAG
jgi:hypothetical protein